MTDVVGRIVDEDSFFEVAEDFARNIVIGFDAWTVTASVSSATSRESTPAHSTSPPAKGSAFRALL